MRVLQGRADVGQALTVTERMAQNWTHNMTYRKRDLMRCVCCRCWRVNVPFTSPLTGSHEYKGSEGTEHSCVQELNPCDTTAQTSV